MQKPFWSFCTAVSVSGFWDSSQKLQHNSSTLLDCLHNSYILLAFCTICNGRDNHCLKITGCDPWHGTSGWFYLNCCHYKHGGILKNSGASFLHNLAAVQVSYETHSAGQASLRLIKTNPLFLCCLDPIGTKLGTGDCVSGLTQCFPLLPLCGLSPWNVCVLGTSFQCQRLNMN